MRHPPTRVLAQGRLQLFPYLPPSPLSRSLPRDYTRSFSRSLTHSLWCSLQVSLPLARPPLSISTTLFHSLSLTVCASVYLSLSFPLSVFHSLSLSLSRFSLARSLSRSLLLSLALSRSLSRARARSLSRSLARSLALCGSRSVVGTGKSTTIFHIIYSRIPVGARVLVTCSRNVAVESIVQKLEQCTNNGERLVVFGNEARIGDTSKKHLLRAKCQRLPRVRELEVFASRMDKAGKELEDALADMQQVQARVCKKISSVLWQRAWVAYIRFRCALPLLFKDWAQRVTWAGQKTAQKVALASRGEVLREASIMVCTIASSRLLLTEWNDSCEIEPLQMHTIIGIVVSYNSRPYRYLYQEKISIFIR